MNFESLDQQLTAKILFFATLQRTSIRNPNGANEANNRTLKSDSPWVLSQQQQNYPFVMPPFNISPQNILSLPLALKPLSTQTGLRAPTDIKSTDQSTVPFTGTKRNNSVAQARMDNSSSKTRLSSSNFGWRNRQRKMEENWRMQSRNV